MGRDPGPGARTAPFRETGARFSTDRRYRYTLWRAWDDDRDLCNFLMLNPSTADATADDPTVARCTRRARLWGYGGLVVTDVNDIDQLAPLFNAVPEVAGKVGHPKRKPDALQGDLAYDSEPHRQGSRELGVEPVLSERQIDDQEGLGETRWPVEGTRSWTHQNRRLRIRYERRPDIHQAVLTLDCIKICASILFSGFCSIINVPTSGLEPP